MLTAARAAKDARTTAERLQKIAIAEAQEPDILAQTFGDPRLYAVEPDVKVAIADEAKNIVAGARRSAYGKPEQNFERIAHFWTAYAKAKGWPIEFAAADVSPLMRLMKEARLVESPAHRDSFVDIVGYALTGAEVNGVKA